MEESCAIMAFKEKECAQEFIDNYMKQYIFREEAHILSIKICEYKP